MKPLFTVHAGEYLVGSYIEENFKNCNIWVPAKDTGIDLLVTKIESKKTVSLQVKYSKNYNVAPIEFGPNNLVISRGWWTLNRNKIKSSKADFWVFVLYNFDPRLIKYVIIGPQKLLSKLEGIHGQQNRYDMYLSVKKVKTQITCWETRGLRNNAIGNLGANNANNGAIGRRNFTRYLNNLDPVKRKLGLLQP